MIALRALLVVFVLIAMALFPVYGSGANASPASPSMRADREYLAIGPDEVRFVAANDNDDNDDGGDDNGGGTPDGGAGRLPLDPRVVPGAGVPIPQAAASEVNACLSAGGQLTLIMDGANAAIRNVSGSVNVTLKRADASSVPATPGPRLGNIVFEVSGGACGGGLGTNLPQEVNLGVSYESRLASGLNEANLVLARLEAGQWVPAAKGAADAPNNFVSATIQQGGTYTVYQK